MCVGAVGAVGSGGGTINPILMERYAVLNREMRIKRLSGKKKYFEYH